VLTTHTARRIILPPRTPSTIGGCGFDAAVCTAGLKESVDSGNHNAEGRRTLVKKRVPALKGEEI
jgi:hypothetical protein